MFDMGMKSKTLLEGFFKLRKNVFNLQQRNNSANRRFKSHWLFFAFCFFLYLTTATPICAQEYIADDVTLIGENQSLASLQNPQSLEITTTGGEKLTLEVNDAVVEEHRVRIRFLIWGLSPQWSEKISDDSRIYGSYLPVAELGLPSGNWLTPGSGSHFSLIDNGNTVVIAGLLEFLTDETPKTVSFDFNQVPFDTEPLAEGAVMVLEFADGNAQVRKTQSPLSDTKHDVTFSLLNFAQTPNRSMIQPAIHLNREDEQLVRIGWVSLATPDGKKYALKRESSYGFNIVDDDQYVTGNAYTFLAVNTPQPLIVSLDHVYLRRTTTGSLQLTFPEPLQPGTAGQLEAEIPLKDFQAGVTGYAVYTANDEGHEFPILRLFIQADHALSKINFESNPDIAPLSPVECGFVPESDQFACDFHLETTDITELEFSWNSVEFRLDGAWSFEWRPLNTLILAEKKASVTVPVTYDFSGLVPDGNPDLVTVAENLVAYSDKLSKQANWIFQRSEIKLGIAGEEFPELIPHADKDQQVTDVIQETWDQVAGDGTVISNITLMKNPDDETLISGTWNLPDTQILLPQALVVNRADPGGTVIRYPFFHGSDFIDLLTTNAQAEPVAACQLDKISAWCYSFTHVLSASENAVNAPQNKYRFWFDKESGRILQKEVRCQLNGTDAPLETCVLQKNEEPVALAQPDQEINDMIQAILY